MESQVAQSLTGFGNHFSSEAIPGALPKGQNSPQCHPLGLYTEQLTGSAFTAPRSSNRRSWLYRIRPSVIQGKFQPISASDALADIENFTAFGSFTATPEQMRWDPLPMPSIPTDFWAGLIPWAAHGDGETSGATLYLYACNLSIASRFFYSADGEWLFVPQQGLIEIHTELGILRLLPGHIGVVPRGVKFQVSVSGEARGYCLENHGQPFQLPELGPIGANGLANPRDFVTPHAHYNHEEGDYFLITKYAGKCWVAELAHHPLDVVAWHGNYVPYQYDLKLFNTMNTVSFDHPDPSIFTVITSPSGHPGVANCDFVIFPERWMVAEHTFRPPYYHRNLMSEFMGLIAGRYDAKENGFLPGGASLHNSMSAHGPDLQALTKGESAALVPQYYKGTLAFMFESRLAWRLSDYAMNTSTLQKDYLACWQSLPMRFSGMKS